MVTSASLASLQNYLLSLHLPVCFNWLSLRQTSKIWLCLFWSESSGAGIGGLELVGAKMRQLQEPGWRRPRNPLSRLPKKPAMPNMPPNKRPPMPGPAGSQTCEGGPWACRRLLIKLTNLLLSASPQHNTFKKAFLSAVSALLSSMI